jgi:hypothetical protein
MFKAKKGIWKLTNLRKLNVRLLFVVLLIAFLIISMSMFATSQFAEAQGTTRVQGPINSGTHTGNALSASLSSTPTEGNLLIAVAGIDSESTKNYTVSSVTQTGVTWTRQVSSNFSLGGIYAFGDIEIWAGVVGSGASKTVTAHFTNSTTYGISLTVCEYSGLVTSGFLDQKASNRGDSANPNTGTTNTTTQINELWIGAIVMDYTPQTNPATNGFTLFGGEKMGECSYGYLEKIVFSTGQANAGDTGGVEKWAGCIATFIAISQTPSPTPTQSASPTPTPTLRPTATPRVTQTPAPSGHSSPTPTTTSKITATPTGTPTPSGTPAVLLVIPIIALVAIVAIVILIKKRKPHENP